jgi:RNA polymerase sigma-70 factor (ECF subfamily)
MELTDKKLMEIRKDVITFVKWKMGNDVEAEDFAQDTLIKVITNIDVYDESKSFRTWYISIANNMIIDMYRRNKDIKEFSISDYLNDNGTEKIQIADASVNAENSDTHKQIRKAIRNLKFEYRKVIVLRFIQNMSCNEIAEYCDMPLNSVLSMIARGKKLLQEQLQGQLV